MSQSKKVTDPMTYQIGKFLELRIRDRRFWGWKDGFQFGEKTAVDLGIVQDIEYGDGIGDSGSVIACRENGEDLIAKTLLVWNLIALLGNGNQKAFHHGRELRHLSIISILDELVNLDSCDLLKD